MSSSHRRASRAGSARGATRSLIRWLAGSALAGSTLASSALPYKSSQPYLATLPPVPLRFAPPPPDLSTDPAPAAPPNPDGVLGDMAQSNLEAVAPPLLDPPPDPAETRSAPVAVAPVPAPAPTAVPPDNERAPPVELLPDDLSPRIAPEDVLPFFLPPRVPSTPSSRAIYQQK